MQPDLDVLIVGAGFSGLCAAIRLEKEGKRRYQIIERESELGGTWWVNRYPGCGCDVASHLYSFSFAPNPQWSRSFSGSEEIWRYLKDCAQQFGVAENLRLGTAVHGLEFDEAAGVWAVTLGHDEVVTARSVILATGALSRPRMPDIDGLDSFAGELFHSQQWNHDYDLNGKNVAVIGTGASAIQFVPHLAKRVKTLTVYQRSAPWILPKPDRQISRLEHWLYRRLPWLQRFVRARIYSTNEFRAIAFLHRPALLKVFEALAMRHLRKSIADQTLRARVTPDYRIGCKRVLISNDYYPAIAQSNVEIIAQGVRALDATGVIGADGQHRPCDAVVLGTGFRVSAPFDPGFVTGLKQRDLAGDWHDGPEAYLGTVIAGYPNLFMLAGPNTALGHNSMIYMIESQMNYVMSVLRMLDTAADQRLVVGDDVQRRYNDDVQHDLSESVWNTGGCRSWYRHPAGKNVALWPDFTWRFRARTRAVRPDDFTSY
ncbi:MAG: flavin-containing monooxygenase [Gammaproteobacteria bacterium]